MTISLYDVTVPVLIRALDNLSAVLRKGEAFAQAEGLDPAALVAARLAPDMLPLSGQIQRASDTAKGAVVRLGQIENVPFEDSETTFAELQARLGKTVAFVKAAPRGAIDGRDEADIVLQTQGGDLHLTGRDYALGFVLPNVFFHVTTAYGILRHHGVPLGKLDYLGRR